MTTRPLGLYPNYRTPDAYKLHQDPRNADLLLFGALPEVGALLWLTSKGWASLRARTDGYWTLRRNWYLGGGQVSVWTL